MLKIERTVLPSPAQWEIAIEGMRNPKNSWHLSDSWTTDVVDSETGRVVPSEFFVGEADLKLMMSLNKGGSVHAKYRRMLPVIFTVTAPTFWWIEFDTYKISTVRNSCSKMHKIHVAPFTLDNFSHEGCDQVSLAAKHLELTVSTLEWLRLKFNETQDKKYWRALIELLPHGYNMKATIFLNYEVLVGMYRDRKHHKVAEWHTFCAWIETLPYAKELICGEKKEEKN